MGKSPEWDNRLRHIMQWADLEKSRPMFDLFLRLIADGVLDDARGPIAVNSTFWSMLYSLTQERPEWIPEVMAVWLRRRLKIICGAKKADETLPWNDLFTHDQFAANHFHQAATEAPLIFARYVLPVVVELSDAATYAGDNRLPYRDQIWPIVFASVYEMPEAACLHSLTDALGAISTKEANVREFITILLTRKTYISNLLLLTIYRAGAVRFADEAAERLCDEPWRFHCGFSDSPYWTSMQAIRAIIPDCSPDSRSKLESAILDYSSDYEHTPEGHKSIGRSSFALLSAIPEEFRSTSAKARFKELERKFREPDTAPTGIRGGFVGPPIEKEAAERMTDEQWLKAIAKYDSEHRHRATDFLKGGAWELAGMFREFVRNEPERFARLALRLPSNASAAYLDRALDALKDVTSLFELKLELARKAFAEHRIECGKAIADLLGQIEQPFPADSIEMLAWIATEHPDPEKELWSEQAVGKTPYYGGDILTHGINTARGRAAEAIRDLILKKPGYIKDFESTIRKLADDRSFAVRACAASTILAIAPSDWSRAFRLFEVLLEPSSPTMVILQRVRRKIPERMGGYHLCRQLDLVASKYLVHDDVLLRTEYVDRFIRYALHGHADDMRPVLGRMLRSQDKVVREGGARLSSLANLYQGHYDAFIREALQGDSAQRLGIARVASRNIADQKSRVWCESQLLSLINDDDAEVRREAASCFHHLKGQPFEAYSDFIRGFCESRAYETESTGILFALEESTDKLPGITTTVCQKFIDRFSDEANDVRTSRSADVHLVTKLVFRTYHQHELDDWAPRCLDLIDCMCLEGIQGLSKELAEFER